VKDLENVREIVKGKIILTHQKTVERQARKANPHNFQHGDLVMRKSVLPPYPPGAKKFYQKYDGPYKVDRILGSTLWLIPPLDPLASPIQIHADRVKPTQCAPRKDPTAQTAEQADLESNSSEVEF
jgi:hypothetical protein